MNDRLEIFHFENDQVQRLDKFLVGRLPEYSRSRLQGLIKDGYVRVDGDITYKTGQKLQWDSQEETIVNAPTPNDLLGREARKPWDVL